MKCIIYSVLTILICGIHAGRSENEIDLYDQTPRINSYSSTHVRTLIDTDYAKIDDPYVANSFMVKIRRDSLKENRDFCMRVTPNSGYQNSVDVPLESKYTYTEPDTARQVFYYKASRPKMESGRDVHGCYSGFDLDNSLHQFDKGLVEENQEMLNVGRELKPDEWEGWIFGSYSDSKYMLTMGVCQRVWDNLGNEDVNKIKQARKEYIEAGNPLILGGNGNEIDYE